LYYYSVTGLWEKFFNFTAHKTKGNKHKSGNKFLIWVLKKLKLKKLIELRLKSLNKNYENKKKKLKDILRKL